MIHDNQKDRDEYINYLKSIKKYNPMSSSEEMQRGHTIYWMSKDASNHETETKTNITSEKT